MAGLQNTNNKKGYLGLDKLQQDKSAQNAYQDNATIDDIMHVHHLGEARGIPCGLPTLDRNFSWRKGYVYLWSGYPMSGKSEFLNFLSIHWADMNKDNKIVMYSPENYPVRNVQVDLLSARLKAPIYSGSQNAASPDEIMDAKKWLDQHYYFMNFHDIPTMKVILDHWQELIDERKDQGNPYPNMFILDPLSAVAEGGQMGSNNLSKYTKHVFTQFKHFAVNNNVIVNIVEHPIRPQLRQDGSVPPCTVHSIYGGSNIFNRLDCIMILHRVLPEGVTKPSLKDNEVSVETVKMKRQFLNGQLGENTLYFDYKTHTYHELDPLNYAKKVEAI